MEPDENDSLSADKQKWLEEATALIDTMTAKEFETFISECTINDNTSKKLGWHTMGW